MPSNRITDIKCNSTAHISGKIEDGDEIIQINYQTVIGWHYQRVLLQLQESPSDVLLTLKKRPRHTKIYGQIYMKPYRLPSKKRSLPHRFGENLPSPRVELMSTQNFPVISMSERGNLGDSDSSSSSSIMGPPESTKNEKDRLFLPKPRAVLQRRNTICGDQASGHSGNITFWHEINVRPSVASSNLRDKSVSFGFGLENAARPSTCLGIHNTKTTHDKYGDKNGAALKGSLPDIKTVDDKACKLPIKATPAPAPPHPLPLPLLSPAQTTIKRDDDHYTVGNVNTITQNIERIQHSDSIKNKAVKFNTSHNDSTEQINDKDSPMNLYATSNNKSGSVEVPLTPIDHYRLSSKHEVSPKLPLRPRLSNAGNGETSLAEAVNTTLINNQNEITNDVHALKPNEGKLMKEKFNVTVRFSNN